MNNRTVFPLHLGTLKKTREGGGIKTVDSPFGSGRMRRRVDFSERSYKIESAPGA
jgi:hypothetical protein